MLNLTTAKLLFRCESTSHIFLTNGAVMKRQHNLHPCDNVYFIFTLFPSTVEQNFTCTDSLLSGWLKTLTPFGSALASSTRFSLSVSSIVPYPATSQIVRNERIKWIKRKKNPLTKQVWAPFDRDSHVHLARPPLGGQGLVSIFQNLQK